LFASEEVVEVLRGALRAEMARCPFDIDAMVILPDHLHCIWRLPQGDDDYSSRWREVKKAVSRSLGRRTNARGEAQCWQRRFWEHAIRDECDWRRHLDYIHYNPVRHGLVKTPGDWPWSSFSRSVARGWYDPGWGSNPSAEVLDMDLE